jgi:hypothetical protein
VSHQFVGLTSSTRRARRARKSTVARQQHRIEHLGERHVNGIVGAQVLSKRPHPIEQRLVGVALQVQGAKILEGGRRNRRFEISFIRITPECLGHLDVREVRHVQTEGWVGNARRDRPSCGRVEQQFHKRRRIKDDHRASRSTRITSAALRFMRRTGRARSRSSTSWRVGRSRRFAHFFID